MMIKKFLITFLLIFFLVNNCFAAIISNADIDDEDMADITDWTDLDDLDGISSQVTFDSKSCMKLDNGITADGVARRTKDVGTFSTRTVISINVYCDLIGLATVNDFELFVYDGTYRYDIKFGSDGLFNYNTDWIEVGTDLVVQDTWQEWTFDIDWVALTSDIYLNEVLKADDLAFNLTSTTANGNIWFRQQGNATNQISYVDWEKAGSDFVSARNRMIIFD